MERDAGVGETQTWVFGRNHGGIQTSLLGVVSPGLRSPSVSWLLSQATFVHASTLVSVSLYLCPDAMVALSFGKCDIRLTRILQFGMSLQGRQMKAGFLVFEHLH